MPNDRQGDWWEVRQAPIGSAVAHTFRFHCHVYVASCVYDEPAPGRIFVQSDPIGLKWNLLTGGWNLGAAVFLPREGTAAICYSGQEDQK